MRRVIFNTCGITTAFYNSAYTINAIIKGGLVEGLSKDEFFSGVSMPRNRELVRIFKDLELVEHLGSCMQKILHAYNKSVFQFTDNFMKIIIPFETGFEESLEKILRLIAENPQITISELTEKIGITQRAIEKKYQPIEKKTDKIKRVGADKGGY